MEKHLPNILLGLWAFCICSLLLFISKAVRPHRTSGLFRSNVGLDETETQTRKPWVRSSPQFHLLLSCSILICMAVMMVYPAAASFRKLVQEGQGLKAFGELGLYMGIMAVGFTYSLKKGDLNWKLTNKEESGQKSGKP